MTATNHVVTGALVMTAIANPMLGLTVALLIHPVMDALPHFGVDPYDTKLFAPVLLTDMILAASVLLALLIGQPPHYWLLIAGAIICASPDLLSIPFFISTLRRRKHHFGLVGRFLGGIQWSETVLPGLPIEVLWLGITGTLLLQRI